MDLYIPINRKETYIFLTLIIFSFDLQLLQSHQSALCEIGSSKVVDPDLEYWKRSLTDSLAHQLKQVDKKMAPKAACMMFQTLDAILQESETRYPSTTHASSVLQPPVQQVQSVPVQQVQSVAPAPIVQSLQPQSSLILQPLSAQPYHPQPSVPFQPSASSSSTVRISPSKSLGQQPTFTITEQQFQMLMSAQRTPGSATPRPSSRASSTLTTPLKTFGGDYGPFTPSSFSLDN